MKHQINFMNFLVRCFIYLCVFCFSLYLLFIIREKLFFVFKDNSESLVLLLALFLIAGLIVFLMRNKIYWKISGELLVAFLSIVIAIIIFLFQNSINFRNNELDIQKKESEILSLIESSNRYNCYLTSSGEGAFDLNNINTNFFISNVYKDKFDFFSSKLKGEDIKIIFQVISTLEAANSLIETNLALNIQSSNPYTHFTDVKSINLYNIKLFEYFIDINKYIKTLDDKLGLKSVCKNL
ncbi:MAG: hypothetical protein WA057_01785 [Candidatus Magasanikiibacteriota bacterium]